MPITAIKTPKTKLPYASNLYANKVTDKQSYKEAIRITGAKSRQETIFNYQMGDQMEVTGRHYKRIAIAEEFLSGRTMTKWCKLAGCPEGTMRELLTECRTLGLLPSETSDVSEVEAEDLSKALPTKRAVQEFTKAEPETKKLVQEKAVNNETVSAKEIKDADEEVKSSKLTEEEQIRDSANLEITRLIDQVNSCEKKISSIQEWLLPICNQSRLNDSVEALEKLAESIFELQGQIKDELAAKEVA